MDESACSPSDKVGIHVENIQLKEVNAEKVG